MKISEFTVFHKIVTVKLFNGMYLKFNLKSVIYHTYHSIRNPNCKHSLSFFQKFVSAIFTNLSNVNKLSMTEC